MSAQGFKEGGVAVARVAGREETASPFGGEFLPSMVLLTSLFIKIVVGTV